MENKTYKDSIYMHEENAGKMTQKLAEYKNPLIKANLRNQIYHVKKWDLFRILKLIYFLGLIKIGILS